MRATLAFLRRCQVMSSVWLWVVWVAGVVGEETAVYVGDRVVDAVNCGGPAHTDVHGVRYREDFVAAGTASDHGKRFLIGRVNPKDQILYQTERYHLDDFTYPFKILEDGDYTLVLKFSEVYFTAPTQKVFDVEVNGVHIVTDLDIFSKVGRAVAHDEYIPFNIKAGQLTIAGNSVDFTRKLYVNFKKGIADNPKVNAIVVLKGRDAPRLPDLPVEEEEEEEEEGNAPPSPDSPAAAHPAETEEEAAARRAKLASGPKTPDPYSSQDQSQMLIPILVVVLAFFPVLFCLCKL